jgi:hemerythrin superfamily protein
MANRMDHVIAKGAGAAKGIKARVEGLHGVFATLATQHGEAGQLIKTIQGNEEKRADLWPDLRAALIAHERGETRSVYPELMRIPETRELAQQHDREANQLETLIQRLDATEITSAAWGKLFDELASTVTSHVKEEEGTIFPAAQDALGSARTNELDAKFKAAHDAAQPH